MKLQHPNESYQSDLISPEGSSDVAERKGIFNSSFSLFVSLPTNNLSKKFMDKIFKSRL